MKTSKRIVTLLISVLFFMCLNGLTHTSKASEIFSLSGQAHVQTYGDKDGNYQDGILTLGTTGEAKRLESIIINFENNTEYEGNIQYRVHRQTYGWTDWVDGGCAAGTTGQGKRLEAIQIRLTGELAEHYSVKYRVHIQTYGWQQGWQYDGALAGTEGEAKRLESLEVQIVPKIEEMGIIYRVHRQTYGWEMPYMSNGEVAGTTGEGKRLEGIEIALTGNEYSGSVVYSTHVQSYGWMGDVYDGMMSGTTGKSKRLEAIHIELTGEVAEHYDIYYRVHAQSYGWLGWAKNGYVSGTWDIGKRLEAIQIVLVKKDEGVPPVTYKGVTQDCYYSAMYLYPDGSFGGNSSESSKKLIVDPYIACQLYTSNMKDYGAYVLEMVNDPGLGGQYSTAGWVKSEIYHNGFFVDDKHFKTEKGEIIDLDDLDWYCIHDMENDWSHEYEDEGCICKEFIKKQYGVIYFDRVEYSRCKHPNRSAWDPSTHPKLCVVFRTVYYEICDDCGAIFDVCPHTNQFIGEPYYWKTSYSSTGVYKQSIVNCLDCEANCPSILEEISPCEHDNVRIRTVEVYKHGDVETVWCDDCECRVGTPGYYDFGE